MTTSHNPNPYRIDPDLIRRRFLNDPDLLEEIIGLFEKNVNNSLDLMKSFYRSNVPLNFADIVHKLRGSTLNFTQSGIVERLSEIEHNTRAHAKIEVSEQELLQIEDDLRSLIASMHELAVNWRTRLTSNSSNSGALSIEK